MLIKFVLKIIQEFFAGFSLAHLSTGSRKDLRQFNDFVSNLVLKRAVNIKNVLMFACGKNPDVASVITSHLVKLQSEHQEAGHLKLYMENRLDYQKCSRQQKLLEIFLHLNYECHKKGHLIDVLKPLFDGCNRVRLIGTSAYSARSLGYFLQHGGGEYITSVEIIRLDLDSGFGLRLFINMFYGLEEHVAKTIKKKRKRMTAVKEPLTDIERRKELRAKITSDLEVPHHLRKSVTDEIFIAVFPLWQELSKLQMGKGTIGPIVTGLKHTPLIEELILNGVQVKQDQEWEDLFSVISSQSQPELKTLILTNTYLSKELLDILVSVLKKQRNLQYLDISGNKVESDFLKSLEECLPMSNLQTLSLHKTEMDSESIRSFGKLLEQFPKLRVLDVRRNPGTDDEGIQSILSGLQHCKNMEGFMISLYKVTSAGINSLKENAHLFSNLKELHLIHAQDPNDIILCATELITTNSKLEDIRISVKPVNIPEKRKSVTASKEVISRFSDAVKNSNSLKYISILSIFVDAESFLLLFNVCKEATKRGLEILRWIKYLHVYIHIEYLMM